MASCLEIMDVMRARNVVPLLSSYHVVMNVCGRAGLWERALECMVEIDDLGIEPNRITYNSLISALEKNGRWMEALDALDDMKESRVREPHLPQPQPPNHNPYNCNNFRIHPSAHKPCSSALTW